MAEEGLDIKTLTTLLMATPKVDVTQSVGRILRQKHKQALVIDIVDQHPVFKNIGINEEFFIKNKNLKLLRQQQKDIVKMNGKQFLNLIKNCLKN